MYTKRGTKKKAAATPRDKKSANETSPKVMLQKLEEATTESVQEFVDALSQKIKTEPNSIRELWDDLDVKMQNLLATTIGFYIGRWSEQRVWFAKDQRGLLLKRSLEREIRALEKAYLTRVLFEREEIPHWGYVVELGRVRFHPLSGLLRLEKSALEEVLRDCLVVFSKRRLGKKRTQNLILLELYVEAWGKRKGTKMVLTIHNIADLVRLGMLLKSGGKEDVNDVENLGHDLARFKKNEANKHLLHSARAYACQLIYSF